MTRNEMIDTIIDSVNGWDLNNLIGWVKYEMREKYKNIKDDQVQYDYRIISVLRQEQLEKKNKEEKAD